MTYIENFKSKEDVINSYSAPADSLDNVEMLLAWYGYGDYCGSSFVLFIKDGKLYEVNGSHCSCYGLEGQWSPEETSWDALKTRHFYGDGCDGYNTAKEEFDKIAAKY